MKTSISFAEISNIFASAKHAPFLCELKEEVDNKLKIIIYGSKLSDNSIHDFSGNSILDEILNHCRLIEPDKKQKFEIVFENYIIYQVRNESFCSFDSEEIRVGKFLIIFKKSKLLDYLSISTDACQLDDGTFYPDRWRHYGIYTQNHIIDIVSQVEPKIYYIM